MGNSISKIRNVLLAEDDDDDFFLLNAALLSISDKLHIVRTKNGVMLSSLLETNLKPDLIILDLNMPFKSGLLFIKEIKSKVAAGIKLIIYSTSSSRIDIEKSYENGADFYLVKPSDYNSTIEQFRSLFGNPNFWNSDRPSREEFVVSDSYN